MKSNHFALPYAPEEICDFIVYSYEWIDELSFLKKLDHLLPNYFDYELAVKERLLKDSGWEGDGEINTIWIPPFIIDKIIKGGADAFLKRFHNPSVVSPESWSKGLILWHVKQKEDGISFICSPIELDIPSYALDC